MAADSFFRAFARRAKYFGFRYRCPFCRSLLRRLAPFGRDIPVLADQRVIGAGRRPNARCPVCGSIDRERLLLHYLRHHTDVFRAPLTVLHVAPEPRLRGRLQRCRNLTYIATDLIQPAMALRADLARLPVAGGAVDVVLCSHVLEHLPDDRAALRELFRVLRPGGWAALLVPIADASEATREDPAITDPRDRERVFGQRDHVRLYGRDFATRVGGVGFQMEVFDWRATGGSAGDRLALNRGELVYRAVRPR